MMRFNLILLINLVSITSIRCPNVNHVPGQMDPPRVLQQCHFVELVKRFYNCEVPSKHSSEFTEDAIPYICFLTLKLIEVLCRENSTVLWESYETNYKSHVNKTICPFNYYAIKTKNLSAEVSNAANYFANDVNCKKVCYFNNHTLDDCFVMASLNKMTLSLNEKGEELTMNVSLPLEQMTSQNASTKPIVVNPKNKSENAVIVQTKVENSGVDYDENRNKTPVKTDTIKKVEEKTNNEKFGTKPKINISEISKGIHTNNVNAKSNINVKNDDDNNNNRDYNNNDNMQNNNENGGPGDKVGQNAVSGGKTDVTETEISSLKEVNDHSLYSLSDKKDDTYGPNIKGSDEGVDDGNNEVSGNDGYLPENARLQDVEPDREYDLGRVTNPKELYNEDGLFQAEDSHFSVYFLMTVSIIIIGYIIYHNKNKIVAYALEGRRSRNGRRRPTSASYRKLDCNLEEAIASNPSHASVTNVVY